MKNEVYYASVTKIVARSGGRGSITQVKVEIHGTKQTIYRNVLGPVQVNDVLALLECEREARKIR